jgi:hypothetical protein
MDRKEMIKILEEIARDEEADPTSRCTAIRTLREFPEPPATPSGFPSHPCGVGGAAVQRRGRGGPPHAESGCASSRSNASASRSRSSSGSIAKARTRTSSRLRP